MGENDSMGGFTVTQTGIDGTVSSVLPADALRAENQRDIYERYKLLFVTGEKNRKKTVHIALPESTEKWKIAVICHVFYGEYIQELAALAKNFPAGTDFFVTTSSEGNREKVLSKFGKTVAGTVTCAVIPNRGRCESALLCACRHVVLGGIYDLLYFVHDKKAGHVKKNAARTFRKLLLTATAGNPQTVQEIIALFQSEPKLGLLSSPPPNFGEYKDVLNISWKVNYENVKNLAEKLALNVPIEEHKPPVAPLGTVFWFRPDALRKLSSANWEYDDFPREPLNAVDGTVLHALERVYALCAQDAGYFPAHTLTVKQISRGITV